MSKELMDYFIQRTDKRFDRIEKKMDELLKFKWRIAGGIAFVSFLVTIGVQFVFKIKGM